MHYRSTTILKALQQAANATRHLAQKLPSSLAYYHGSRVDSRRTAPPSRQPEGRSQVYTSNKTIFQHLVRKFTSSLALAAAALLLISCSSTNPALFDTERARAGTLSQVYPALKAMPAPKDKVVAAVYRFRDQTGQYKESSVGASWSTAVSQGATSMLIESLEESGWFTPIEREGLSNLLNERKIINNTRVQHNQQDMLPPLLFAGVLLEGGIIGYDSNILTGGAGARLLGTGGSTQYRKDQVTIYLRAVSTQSGRVLKTVHTTKSIISQEVQAGVFRYIDANRLLEAEAGFTYNEPPVMAVTEAIDEAVRQLVVEGVEDELWSPANSSAFAVYETRYQQYRDWQERAEIDYFGLTAKPEWRKGLQLSASGLLGSHIGSYRHRESEPGYGVELEYFLDQAVSVKTVFQQSRIGATDVFNEPYKSLDLSMQYYLAPYHRLSPYLGIGGGVIRYDRAPTFTGGRQYFEAATLTGGFDYRISDNVALQLNGNYRYLFSDHIDGVALGTINDQQWSVNLGVSIKPINLIRKLFKFEI